MSPFSQIITVTLWEFRRFFKPKNELIGIVVMLFIFSIGFFGGRYAASGEETKSELVVADNTDEYLISMLQESFEVTLLPADETGKHIGRISETEEGKYLQMQGDTFLLHAWEEPRQLGTLKGILDEYDQLRNMEREGVSGETLEKIFQGASLEETYFQDSFRRNRNIVAISFAILMVLAVFVSFAYQFTAITGEKQIKITEQIVSAIRPQRWMDGKILGITLTGIASVITYSIIGLLAGMLVSQFTGYSVFSVFDSLYFPSLAPTVILFLLFTILGILFWNAFLAAVASLINDPNNSGKTSFMMVPILFVVLSLLVLNNPDGTPAVFLSWFPLTSASAMPVRIAVSSVEWWQVAGSFAVLALAFYFLRMLAAMIFRFSILMTGKELSWLEVFRALTAKTPGKFQPPQSE